MPTRIYYAKLLHLVTPDAALRLGLSATDAPVFVSPFVQSGTRCPQPDCPIIYTPLVYAPGMVTQSQHFHHSESESGIYLKVVHSRREAVLFGGEDRGFVAFVEPLGQGRRDIFDLRAEAMRVISIAAYEYDCGWEASWLTEGLLRERKFVPGTLVPVRANEDQEPGALRFQVKDGAVFFTQKRPSTC